MVDVVVGARVVEVVDVVGAGTGAGGRVAGIVGGRVGVGVNAPTATRNEARAVLPLLEPLTLTVNVRGVNVADGVIVAVVDGEPGVRGLRESLTVTPRGTPDRPR